MAISAVSFTVDFKQLEALKKDFQFNKPKNLAYAIRQTLNDSAFAVMWRAKKNVLPHAFHIRNAFVLASIIVNKVPQQMRNPNYFLAEVGAAKKWGMNKGRPFNGMRLQEFGGMSKDTRIFSLDARGGSFAGMPKRKYWGKSATKKPDEFPGQGNARVTAMLRMLDRQNFKGQFIISGSNKIRHGVYIFGKSTFTSRKRPGLQLRSIRMVKDLSHTHVYIKPRYWLKQSIAQSINQGTITRFFMRAADKHLQFQMTHH